uniref:Erythronate-4-phosphate dehydrogenase family protein n=1 Tax=Kalanchoe fedtschenkoi TaxID=63787 RepID=A0A7N0TDQ5_KALFE
MESSCVVLNQTGAGMNGFKIASPSPYHHQPGIKPASLPWLDLRVFYVRVSKCEIDDSTPELLTLNHVPLNRDTLLEVNGARASIYSDGVTTLLRRDRVDKKSEEATFVSTDSVRVTGSVKFEVFDKDVLVLAGVLELGDVRKSSVKKSDANAAKWSMDCESDMVSGSGFFKGSHHSSPPKVEVYVAGCFAGSPIILTKMLQLGPWKKLRRKSMLDTIPEYEATECRRDPPPANLSLQKWEHLCQKYEEDYGQAYYLPSYMEGEDGELTWFNAGVRVGVGIGLSVCLGIGVGVGLLARTYQGTTRRSIRGRLL